MKRFINNTKSAAGSAQRKLLPVAVTAAMLLVAVVPSDVLAMGPSSFGPQFDTRPGAPTHDFSFDFESTSESCSGDEEPSFNARLVPNETLDCGEDFEDCFELPSKTTANAKERSEIDSPTLHRVMFEDSRGKFVQNDEDDQFRFWTEEGVTKKRQSRTFIATFPEPEKSDVRHLVFTLSGQQETPITSVADGTVNYWLRPLHAPRNIDLDGDYGTDLTGQSYGWRSSFEEDAKMSSEVDSDNSEDGFPFRLLMKDRGDGTPLRDLEDTFVAMAYDHQYNWEATSGKGDKVKNAFLRWLQSKFDTDKIETVFLAGHSRGGCLASRLGQDLAKALPADVKIMVQVHDGVCKNKELGKYVGPFTAKAKKVHNPIKDDKKFKASPTNFDKTFRRPLWDDSGWMSLQALVTSRNVRIVNFVSGGPGPMGVNAMTHSDELATSFEVLRHGIPLVRQQWRTESHAGLQDDAVDDGWRHAVQMCDELCC